MTASVGPAVDREASCDLVPVPVSCDTGDLAGDFPGAQWEPHTSGHISIIWSPTVELEVHYCPSDSSINQDFGHSPGSQGLGRIHCHLNSPRVKRKKTTTKYIL